MSENESPLSYFRTSAGSKAVRGFTLIELLVVIAIIGMLSSIVLASLNSGRNKAKVASAVAQIREMRTALASYVTDTRQAPPTCAYDCTSANDPYLNALGVPGWNGPYIGGGVWNLRHPWGGHFSIETSDVTGDGAPDTYFFLDDDAPGTNSGDNSGVIPLQEMIDIDRILDDGDLATGSVRGNAQGYAAALGEMVVILSY